MILCPRQAMVKCTFFQKNKSMSTEFWKNFIEKFRTEPITNQITSGQIWLAEMMRKKKANHMAQSDLTKSERALQEMHFQFKKYGKHT